MNLKVTLRRREIQIVRSLVAGLLCLLATANFASAQGISFYGLHVPITADRFRIRPEKALTAYTVEPLVTKALEQTLTSEKPLALTLQTFAVENQLNDWAIYKLVETVALQRCEANDNFSQTVLAASLLKLLGYDAQVISVTGTLALRLAMPFVQQLFAQAFYMVGDRTYYQFEVGGLLHQKAATDRFYFIQESLVPSATKPIDMRLRQMPTFPAKPVMKRLAWQFNDTAFEIQASLNQNIVDFMESYPQVDTKAYFESVASAEFISSVQEPLRRLLAEKKISGLEAINFLLRFVQTAFPYKVDLDAYGYEKPMFIEQTVALPYSDCKDRAVLIHILVRSILGLDTIGLDYPDHISLGVAFSDSRVSGTYYVVKGRKYWVCDGTYINASLGQMMPQLKGIKARVMMFDTN